jgi:hypothetical protein
MHTPPSPPRPRALALLLAIAASLPACSAGARRGSRTGSSTAQGGTDAGGSPQRPQDRPGEVNLTGEDLAPMDGWIKKRRWLIADDVEVTASREYFAQNLSVTERIGSVTRSDSDQNGTGTSVLTYIGTPDTIDQQTAPRVMIGTGLTVMARRRLTIHLVKTRDTNVPVQVRVRALGMASAGSAQQVIQRADALTIGARIYRGAEGVYLFEES